MAQGFWGTTSGRNSGGIKASPSSSSSSASASAKGSSFSNSGGRKGKAGNAGRKLQAALGMYPSLNAQKAAKAGHGAGLAAPVAASGFAAPRDAASIAAAAPAPAAAAAAAPAKAKATGRKLSGGFVYGAYARSSPSYSTGSAKAASTGASANANRKAKAGGNAGRRLEAALGMYPTLQNQKASIAAKSAASAGGAPVAVSGFAAPRNVAAPAPAPAKH
jgi:hypothetical protein